MARYLVFFPETEPGHEIVETLHSVLGGEGQIDVLSGAYLPNLRKSSRIKKISRTENSFFRHCRYDRVFVLMPNSQQQEKILRDSIANLSFAVDAFKETFNVRIIGLIPIDSQRTAKALEFKSLLLDQNAHAITLPVTWDPANKTPFKTLIKNCLSLRNDDAHEKFTGVNSNLQFLAGYRSIEGTPRKNKADVSPNSSPSLFAKRGALFTTEEEGWTLTHQSA